MVQERRLEGGGNYSKQTRKDLTLIILSMRMSNEPFKQTCMHVFVRDNTENELLCYTDELHR